LIAGFIGACILIVPLNAREQGWGKPKQSHEAEIEHRYVVEIPLPLSDEEWQEKYSSSSIPLIDLKMIRQY
jgi:hypothetical protein